MLLETPYEMAFGVAQWFRKIRKVRKISIKEVAEKSGVPYSTVRRFESKGEISFLSFVKIASAIGEDSAVTGLFAEYAPKTIEEVILGNRR